MPTMVSSKCSMLLLLCFVGDVCLSLAVQSIRSLLLYSYVIYVFVLSSHTGCSFHRRWCYATTWFCSCHNKSLYSRLDAILQTNSLLFRHRLLFSCQMFSLFFSCSIWHFKILFYRTHVIRSLPLNCAWLFIFVIYMFCRMFFFLLGIHFLMLDSISRGSR